MRLLEEEKTYEGIKKIPLAQKQERILEIQKKGFKYKGKEIVEIIKDKWVFLQKDSETDIQDIDFVIWDWAEKEEKQIEKEEANAGNSVAERYFRKHGVMSKKENPKDNTLHNQIVYFDGKPVTNNWIGWNMELFMYRLGVYKSVDRHYSNSASYVKFYADVKIEDCMEAKMKGDEPTIRHSHDWYTNPHKNTTNHYKHENWLEDIETAKSAFIKEVSDFIKDYEVFKYNSKKNILCIPEQFVFWFYEEVDHNGDDTCFYKSSIYSKNKYKGMGYRNTTCTVPAKFDKTMTKEEVLQMAIKSCEEKFEKYNFRKEFKY